MSDVPAGWYDDPEDPNLYRYWDGASWSDHRSPKRAPAAPGGNDASGGAIVSRGWNLFWSNWVAMMAVGAAILVILGVGLAIAFVQLNSAFEPSILDILDRVTDPSFNPDTNPIDEAFFDSIVFDPSPSFWVTIPVVVLLMTIGQGLGSGVAAVHLAASDSDRPHTIGESLQISLSRLPRWIGVYLIWFLAYIVGFAIVAVAFILASLLPVLWIVVIPALIALVIYGYPYVWLAGMALLVGPTDQPPFRSTVALIRARGWGRVAGPVFIVNLALVGINLVTSLLGIIPLIGFLISIGAGAVLGLFTTAMNVPLWRSIGGTIGTDITGPQTDSSIS